MTLIDFTAVDPDTLVASDELDAWIAEKWMGWTPVEYAYHTVWDCGDGRMFLTGTFLGVDSGYPVWSPSTNAAHAGEVRRKAVSWSLSLRYGHETVIECWIETQRQFCELRETNGDKAKADALAICRAIVAALQAAEKGKKNS